MILCVHKNVDYGYKIVIGSYSAKTIKIADNQMLWFYINERDKKITLSKNPDSSIVRTKSFPSECFKSEKDGAYVITNQYLCISLRKLFDVSEESELKLVLQLNPISESMYNVVCLEKI